MTTNIKWLKPTSAILVSIGAITWGTQALFNFNIVEAILGNVTWLKTTIYTLIGVSGITNLWNYIKK